MRCQVGLWLNRQQSLLTYSWGTQYNRHSSNLKLAAPSKCKLSYKSQVYCLYLPAFPSVYFLHLSCNSSCLVKISAVVLLYFVRNQSSVRPYQGFKAQCSTFLSKKIMKISQRLFILKVNNLDSFFCYRSTLLYYKTTCLWGRRFKNLEASSRICCLYKTPDLVTICH